MNVMKFDLKTPCKNCPFRSDGTAIRFSCRERAQEIEESAFRNGFPCHLSAVNTQDEYDDEDGGYDFNRNGNTQHCAGALIMFMNEGYDSTPGTGNDEELFERLGQQLDFNAPVFKDSEEFLAASTKEGSTKRLTAKWIT